MKRSRAFLFFVLLLFFLTAHGQIPPDTVHIREIKVLAKRKIEEAGLKITRPDSLQIISSLTTDLSELLANYSPVFIKSQGRGSQATASFRGTAATHTQILWNGMNLNSPMRGVSDLSLFPVFFVDEVYILHGGSSMIKGSGALGGSIHLENNPQWHSGVALEGLAETGSFHSGKSFFKLNAGGTQFQSTTRFFYDASENNFPFYNSGVIPKKTDTLSNAGYRKAGILQEFYFRRLYDRLSSFRVWYQKSMRDLPQLMSYQGSEREEYQIDSQLRVQYDWKKYSDELNFHFFSGINTTRLNYYRATPEFQHVNEDSHSVENGLSNHLRIFRKFDEKTWATISIDANYHQVETINNLRGEGYRHERIETSLLTNLHFKPSDRLAAYVLLRSENYDKRLVPFIPSAGIEWQIFSRAPLVLRSNVARNYHKPTLNDLYWIPGGNSGLLPEDGYTGDLSLAADFVLGRSLFRNELTGFVSMIENWIIWQPAASGAYYWEANNLRDVLSQGIEYQFITATELKSLRFRSGGNYSFTSTANLNAVSPVDESRGKQLVYIPKHKGSFYFSASWEKYSLKYDLSGVGKRYTKSSNQESEFERVLNPYWLSKLSLGKQVLWSSYTCNLMFAAENLFNQNYQSILWRPMPGRFYTFSVSIKYRKP